MTISACTFVGVLDPDDTSAERMDCCWQQRFHDTVFLRSDQSGGAVGEMVRLRSLVRTTEG